ncbi:sensor histidine kinase KdpD [Desulfitobacterium sp.]|uniref:sensor histidine kinase KdpD n=1 Tax=Desulfitobacterium sp. TaxID=49981 RepID=UPI002B1F6982|nr:sensor histidine kinase KdpD [Desulfitobacterium sp.]MEA4902146.1 sensor histidine kinase KdpD [Desulfitobacterium sp.]
MPKEERRANPDDLLADIEEERRGKLTVFLGAAAGVGKTFGMLETAREKISEGVDLVVGWVEPHDRPETSALLVGIPAIPAKIFEYRNHKLKEMDLDAILARKPHVVLVDELAHTNVPGSRHAKRYQDVEELLAAGINVYTTLNVQHVESFNDIIAQITGVKVRETVPDSILEKARIQLMDIPPEELIQRLKEGKVYVPNQAAKALKKFFRPGNINALRELSMRFAAQRVDRQMETYMRMNGIMGPWPAGERVMVCISSSPFSEQLIRFGRRIAVGMKAELLVVYVNTPRQFPMKEKEKDQLGKNLRLAQELEAEIISLNGENIADELIAMARQRNATQMIIGKPGTLGLRERLTGSIVDQVVRKSQNISVHIIPGKIEETRDHQSDQRSDLKRARNWVPYVEILSLMALITAIGWKWGSFLGAVNIAMLFLLPILLGSVRWGLQVGIFSSITAIVIFDLFIVPPLLSFSVADLRYVISFFIFLLIGIYTGKLSTRLREQIDYSRKREAQTSALYSLSREIAAVSDIKTVLDSVVKKITEIFDVQVGILLPDETGTLVLRTSSNDESFLNESERAVAAWVYAHKQRAGWGTDTLGGAEGSYFPLISEHVIYGVLGITPKNRENTLQHEQQSLLEAFTSLTALAVARISLTAKVREAQLLSESEKLRTALLNSVSHDLRTPLATMIGAVTTLLEDNPIYDETTRNDLLQTIQQGAIRMNRLVNNLLDMARLESGMLKLNKDWYDLEEIIQTAIERLGQALQVRDFRINCRPGLPLIYVDFVLIEQVVVNLLDNALKYSDPGSKILLNVRNSDQEIEVTVHDWGSQIPAEDLENIFDRFYRVRAPRQISGTGLGLAISKGIVELHNGRIWAENSLDGGVSIIFVLPSETVPEIPINAEVMSDGADRQEDSHYRR